ncbi:hypothetical protein [Neorhizobium sp. T6_25]|uniref:hypothetical protein n=1 Tax=Neorhizobium sp. T6_25 TaxID=2093833 RepID=UPI00155F22B1|nr:hypothetical protein [Neorhizobium sp. T6_25]
MQNEGATAMVCHCGLFRSAMFLDSAATEERAEAQEHMAEALRILNAAIRRTHRAGLLVRVEVLTMSSREGTLPQLELGTLDRQHGEI